MGKIKANHALVKALKNWEIDHVYGLPGDSVDAVIDALKHEEAAIKFYQVRHEEVASLTATAYTKLTGKIGVSIAIGGPGAIHLLNGMYDAKMDHVPQLVIVGQTSVELLGTTYFQEVELLSVFEDVAVFNQQLGAADNVYEKVNEAIRTAYAKKGVAVLIVPGDVLKTEIEDHTSDRTERFEHAIHSAPAEKVSEAAELIKNSSNPYVLVGVGAKNAKAEVVSFVERIKAPVSVTLPGKSIVPDTHPNFVGNLGKIGTKPAFEASKESDLLILIGTNYPYTDYLPDHNVKCIQIDLKPEHIGKRYNVDVGLVGDTGRVLTDLITAVEPVSERKFLNACQKNMASWNKWMQEDKEQDATPIRPERIIGELEKIADEDAIFSIDVGTSTVWGTRYLRLNHQNDFLVSAWLGTMGCSLPGAIASKIAFPDRQAIAISGDGAFSMVMQDFVTAVKYDLPMIVVVLNNKELSFIKYEQQAAGELEYAIDLADIDYAKFAEACGGYGFTVTDPSQLAPTFEHAKALNKPVVVNVHVDPDAAPLPGQIVYDEMKGYAKFEIRTLLEEGKIEKMPPLKTILRHLL